jgi:dolichol-phosphate mannosyltransferase
VIEKRVIISVVIPLLEEESLVEELINRVILNLKKITEDFEVLIIDDGSKDKTWLEVSKFCLRDNRIKGLKLSKNFGQHFAITAGIEHVSGDWCVVMDGDLQDRPEMIPDLYYKAQEGYDVVFVLRENRPEKFAYKMLQKFFYLILNILSGLNFDSRKANFSIINSKVVSSFKKFPENARFYGSIIKWLGFNEGLIKVDHGSRFSGKSSYTLLKRLKLATDIIVTFSNRPLKFAIGLGLGISVSAFICGLWVGIRSIIFGFPIIGWASIITTLLFVSGINLMILGVNGIYLGRIFDEVKRRPLYILSEKINF